MDKKLNDCLVTAIQNSPETTISEHSNRQKLEVKELQKNITIWSWKAHVCHNSIKILPI